MPRRLMPFACFLAFVAAAYGKPKPDAAFIAADQPDLWTRKTGHDWPWFLGPTHDGVSAETGVISPWPATGLKLVWQRDIGIGYASPSVSRGRLFVFDALGGKNRLACLRAETGDPLWAFEYPSGYQDLYGYDAGPRCCPVIDGDRVYILGPEGVLHCLAAVTGEVLWKVDTQATFGVVQNFFGVGSTPVIEGEVLIAQIGGSPPGSGETIQDQKAKPNGTAVVAFDKMTGKVRYQFGDELASYASPLTATINGRRWGFVFARGGLIGFDPLTGTQDFHFPWRSRTFESVNAASPIVFDGKVFLSETYGPGAALLAVKPGGYDVVWSDADRGRGHRLQAHWATPIYADGYLYGCSGRHTSNAVLRCLDAKTGLVKWSVPDLTRTTLLMADGHFVCLGEDGTLRLLKVNPEKYEEISALRYRADGTIAGRGDDAEGGGLLKYPCWAAPVLSHGLMYVRGRGRLVCFELIPAK